MKVAACKTRPMLNIAGDEGGENLKTSCVEGMFFWKASNHSFYHPYYCAFLEYNAITLEMCTYLISSDKIGETDSSCV